jgi:hypothetical protein
MSANELTPYERLMAEAIPRGTPDYKPVHEPWTPKEQAKHVTDLLEALNGWVLPGKRAERDRERQRRVPLRLVHSQTADDPAA